MQKIVLVEDDPAFRSFCYLDADLRKALRVICLVQKATKTELDSAHFFLSVALEAYLFR